MLRFFPLALASVYLIGIVVILISRIEPGVAFAAAGGAVGGGLGAWGYIKTAGG